MSPMSQEETWSYSTGRRGVSRVRVYERYPGGPIQIEYTGAPRQTLTNLAKTPITDQALATRIANRLSEELAAEATGKAARQILGLQEPRTLYELLERYHADMEAEWGETHLRQQRHMRKWWAAKLGASTHLTEINEAAVERAVRLAVDARQWSPRTRQKYLRYIMATFAYARKKLKWIREDSELTGVKVPRPDRGGPSYTHAEMVKLLKAAPGVDPRASAALEIAYDTQARSKAVLHLKPSDYLGDGQVRFSKAHDKAKKGRIAVLSPTAAQRVEALIATNPGRWLFAQDGRQMTYDELLDLLRAVEKAAGVPYVSGRGWHAVKRRGVTDARRAVGNMASVSKQSGTTEATLTRIYEQDDLEPKQAVADAMERLRHGG